MTTTPAPLPVIRYVLPMSILARIAPGVIEKTVGQPVQVHGFHGVNASGEIVAVVEVPEQGYEVSVAVDPEVALRFETRAYAPAQMDMRAVETFGSLATRIKPMAFMPAYGPVVLPQVTDLPDLPSPVPVERRTPPPRPSLVPPYTGSPVFTGSSGQQRVRAAAVDRINAEAAAAAAVLIVSGEDTGPVPAPVEPVDPADVVVVDPLNPPAPAAPPPPPVDPGAEDPTPPPPAPEPHDPLSPPPAPAPAPASSDTPGDGDSGD